MEGFFDPSELMILLGYMDRRSEAKKSGVEYHIFCKRLWRKREAFKSILKEAGYI